MALAHCSHCGTSFTPDNGVSVDDCPVCGRSVDCGSATMDSRNPLMTGIEELKEEIRTMPHKEFFVENLQSLVDDHSRLLSLLTPPPDAAVKEAVAFSVEARCSRLARGILRIGKKLRVMRADMASQTDALIAAIHAINDAGILMPDEVLDYASGVRAVQAPRLTGEQREFLMHIEDCLATTNAMWPKEKKSLWYCLRAAFPEVFGVQHG